MRPEERGPKNRVAMAKASLAGFGAYAVVRRFAAWKLSANGAGSYSTE